MSRYLVTGCAGFIGSHVVEALLDRGDTVLGVDSFSDYYARAQKDANLDAARGRDGFTLVEADLAEADLAELVAGRDGVFHLAAQPGVRGSWGDSFATYVRDNVLVTQRVLEVAAPAGVRVVLASTSSVYGDADVYPTPEEADPGPISPYGVTKLTCERLVRAYAARSPLDAVILRYFTVYGPRQRPDMAFSKIFSALLAGDGFDVYGDGEQSRDFTYVEDAVAATIVAMDDAPVGRVYNVGGGHTASLREVISLCESLAGAELDVRFRPAAAGDVRQTAADTSRLRGELGWVPETVLRDGLAAQLSWSRSSATETSAAHARKLG